MTKDKKSRHAQPAPPKRRIGIMGGTFDPIHFGHLKCAEQAAEALALDEVIFVPAGNPSFKQGQKIAPALDRLAMCELACIPNQRFSVSAVEIERDGVTYTIDTAEEMRRELGDDVELFFIIGSDALLTLPQWRRADDLARLVRFAAVMRPGDDRARVVEMAGTGQFAIDVVECPMLDISSSHMRECIEKGRSVRYLTPDSVCGYIRSHGLYGAEDGLAEGAPAGSDDMSEPMLDPLSPKFYDALKSELATRVSAKRMAHIEGVAETARKLASIYGADEQKAELAGLLHDWDKGYDDDGIRARVSEVGLTDVIDPFIVEKMPQVLHGPTAAYALKQQYPQIPADVIRSIYYHTSGVATPTDLDKIIYIADAIEPTRKFDKADWLRSGIGEVDLDELFYRVYKFWTLALVERDKVLHPDTMSIWNALAQKRKREKHAKHDKHKEKPN